MKTILSPNHRTAPNSPAPEGELKRRLRSPWLKHFAANPTTIMKKRRLKVTETAPPAQAGIKGSHYSVFWVAAVLAAAFGGLVALLGSDLSRSYDRESAAAERTADQLTAAVEQYLGTGTEKIDIALREAAEEYAALAAGISRRDTLSANRDLLRREGGIPEIQARSLRVVDAQGRVLFSAGDSAELPNVAVGKHPHFLQHRNDSWAGLVVSEPIFSNPSAQWGFILSRRISRPDGSFAGVVQATMRADYLESVFKTIDIGTHGNLSLFSGNLRLVARYPARDNPLENTFDLREIRNGLEANRTSGSYRMPARSGDGEYIVSYRKIDALPFVINIGIAQEDHLVAWKEKAWIYGVCLLVFALETAGLFFLQRRIGRRNLMRLEQKFQEHNSALTTANHQLFESMQAANSANIAKSQFLATISHELRTPVNGILCMAQCLRGDDIGAKERKDYADKISSSAQTHLALLNDMLNFSQAETGKMEFRHASLTPSQLAKDKAALFAELTRIKGLKFGLFR